MKFYPICLIMGDTFSPSLVEQRTNLRFEKKSEPGEVAKRGRYRNKPKPYGSAKLTASVDTFDALQQLLDALSANASVLRECGAEEIKYYLTVSYNAKEEQCNLEFSATFLKQLCDLGAPLLISI